MMNDTSKRYGAVTMVFHWGMAVLIGWQMLKFFDRIDDGKHWIGQTLVPWHISIGSLLLALIAARIVWVASQRARPAHNPATAFAAKAGHFLLYAAMAAMPVTGVLKMIGGGYGWTAFGVQIVAKGDKLPWAASIGALHVPVAWWLLALTLGHIVMALWHHFFRQDDTLRRIV